MKYVVLSLAASAPILKIRTTAQLSIGSPHTIHSGKLAPNLQWTSGLVSSDPKDQSRDLPTNRPTEEGA